MNFGEPSQGQTAGQWFEEGLMCYSGWCPSFSSPPKDEGVTVPPGNLQMAWSNPGLLLLGAALASGESCCSQRDLRGLLCVGESGQRLSGPTARMLRSAFLPGGAGSRGQEQISGKAASREGPESVTGQDGNDLTSTDKGVPGLCLLFSPSISSGNGVTLILGFRPGKKVWVSERDTLPCGN